MALRLRGISKTPFWLLVFAMQIIPMTGIVAMTMLLGGNGSNQSSTTNTLYYLIGALGAVAIVVTILCHCVVSLRISNLAAMLQQDPQVIVGDPVCLQNLSRTPWYGVSEVDTLQLAVLQTYNAYSLANTPALYSGALGSGMSPALKRSSTDFDQLEWRTAASEDDNAAAGGSPYEDGGGGGGGKPFDPLEAFLLSQRRLNQMEPSATAVDGGDDASPHPVYTSNTRSSPQSTGSSGKPRGIGGVGSAFQRFFTPRGSKAPDFPVVAHPSRQKSGVSAAEDQETILGGGRTHHHHVDVGSLESSDFRSFPDSVDERSLLVSRTSATSAGADSLSGAKSTTRGGSSYGAATTAVAVAPPGYTGAAAGLLAINRSVESEQALAESASLACDPVGDNERPQWNILSRGLKLESSIIVQLLGSIRVGQSLSSVTLPVHILESRSLLEMLGDMFVNWELLMPIAMNKIATPEERVVLLFKWFISAFHLKPRGAKKPYNPILGEVFQCRFPAFHPKREGSFPSRANGNRSLVYLAEQVSHHPPVSAFRAEYSGLLSVHGVYLPKGKMVSLNCAASIGEGSFVISFPACGYKYRVTFPTAYVSGIVAGTPKLELGGTVTISDLGGSTCSAAVEFLRKGWLSGSYDQIHCKVATADRVLHEFVGTWHDKIYVRAPSASPGKIQRGAVFFDPAAYEAELHGTHRPFAVDCNGHLKQSRAIWKDLTVALRAGNAVVAAAAKNAVEDRQRLERKLLAQEKREHQTAFFKFNVGRSVKEATDDERCDEENWDFIGEDQIAQY